MHVNEKIKIMLNIKNHPLPKIQYLWSCYGSQHTSRPVAHVEFTTKVDFNLPEETLSHQLL